MKRELDEPRVSIALIEGDEFYTKARFGAAIYALLLAGALAVMAYVGVSMPWLLVTGLAAATFGVSNICVFAIRHVDVRCSYIEQVCHDMLVAREG